MKYLLIAVIVLGSFFGLLQTQKAHAAAAVCSDSAPSCGYTGPYTVWANCQIFGFGGAGQKCHSWEDVDNGANYYTTRSTGKFPTGEFVEGGYNVRVFGGNNTYFAMYSPDDEGYMSIGNYYYSYYGCSCNGTSQSGSGCGGTAGASGGMTGQYIPEGAEIHLEAINDCISTYQSQWGGGSGAASLTATYCVPSYHPTADGVCTPEVPPCSINSFTADAPTVAYNSSTNLRFTLSGTFPWTISSISGPGLAIPSSGNSSGGVSSSGTLSNTTTYRLSCGSATRDVTVIVPPPPVCSPSSQGVNVGQAASLTASQGDGNYTWSASSGNPSSGSGSSFSTTYSSAGNYNVTVTSANRSDSCTVGVGAQHKYKCSGTICVQDDVNGTFYTSNCDNTCILSLESITATKLSCSSGYGTYRIHAVSTANIFYIRINGSTHMTGNEPVTTSAGRDYDTGNWVSDNTLFELVKVSDNSVMKSVNVGATGCGLPSYTLTVSKSGMGSGTVTSSPSGINCGSTCSANFTSGASVTLTASPAVGSTFTGSWSGEGCSGTSPCTLIMNSNKNVIATFNLISGSVCGNGIVEGREQCDGSNLNGQTCTSQGFTGGTLSCKSECTFNTSSCTSSTRYRCSGTTCIPDPVGPYTNPYCSYACSGGCSYILSPPTVSLGPESFLSGYYTSLNLSTGPSCPWSASTDYPGWISVITYPSSGSGIISYGVSANTGVTRTGHIFAGGAMTTINQAGVSVLPTCSSSAPQAPSTTATSGTFYAYAYGVENATSVFFPTWGGDPVTEDQDDLVWYPGTNLGGGTWRASINLANHKVGNPEYGNFNVHIYMNNASYTNQWCGMANFTRNTSTCSMTATPSPLNFTAIQNGALPSSKTITVTNTGNQALALWGDDSAAWLNTTATAGDVLQPGGTKIITASINTTNLTPNSYNATRWFDGTCGALTAQQQVVTVGYTVTSAPKPHISLSPTSFTFTGVSGGATPAGQTLNISNTGNATLNWTGSTNQTWCHLSSSSGSVNASGSQNVTITMDAPTNVGSFNCTITISDANADNSPRTAAVTYTVTAGSCPAGQVNLSLTSITAGQTSTASAPTGFTGGSFSSSNISVATVSGSTVTGVSAGSSNISGSGWNYTSNGATGCALTARALTVQAKPDLITQSLAYSGTLTPGSAINFSGNVKNNGGSSAAASTARFCIDNASCLTTTTGRVGTTDSAVTALAAGATSAVINPSITWSATVGSHTVYFCADVGSVVSESNETNNCSSLAFTVTAANQAPVANAKISLGTCTTRTDSVTVTQGVPVSVWLCANDSTDPNGWTDATNGVQPSPGKCEWNSDLNQGLPTYETIVNTPASASACNINLGSKTFNDAPGPYTYQVLRITDKPGLQSVVDAVQVVVQAKPQCSDGIDNDSDGKIDSADPGCHTDSNPGNPGSYDPGLNDESANPGVTLTVTKPGNGSGTITSSPSGINCGSTCSAKFTSGASVTLTASVTTGSIFAGWSGACSGMEICTVTMTTAKNVAATFNLIAPPPDFTLNSSNAIHITLISGSPSQTSDNTSISAISLNGFSGTVGPLTAASNITGASYNFSPTNTFTCPGGSCSSVSFSVTVPSTTTNGPHTIVVKDSTTGNSVNVILNVEVFNPGWQEI